MSRDIQKKDYKEIWNEEIQDRELQRGTRGHEDRLRKESSEEVPALGIRRHSKEGRIRRGSGKDNSGEIKTRACSKYI